MRRAVRVSSVDVSISSRSSPAGDKSGVVVTPASVVCGPSSTRRRLSEVRLGRARREPLSKHDHQPLDWFALRGRHPELGSDRPGRNAGGTSPDVLRPVQTGCGGAVQRQIAVTSRAIADRVGVNHETLRVTKAHGRSRIFRRLPHGAPTTSVCPRSVAMHTWSAPGSPRLHPAVLAIYSAPNTPASPDHSVLQPPTAEHLRFAGRSKRASFSVAR